MQSMSLSELKICNPLFFAAAVGERFGDLSYEMYRGKLIVHRLDPDIQESVWDVYSVCKALPLIGKKGQLRKEDDFRTRREARGLCLRLAEERK